MPLFLLFKYENGGGITQRTVTKMKFTINKQTNVRKAFIENGKCVAVFGVAADLLKANILLEVAQGCEQNIVVIQAPDWRITEHSTIEKAKDYISTFFYC